jgi:hypothetical protein
MFFVQTNLLKLVGILPFSKNKTFVKKFLSVILTTLALFILIGSIYSTAFQSAVFIGSIISSQAKAQANKVKSSAISFLPALQSMPFVTINIRASAVLVLFFIKRRHWDSLMLETNHFIHTCFPYGALGDVVKSIRRAGLILCAVTVLLLTVWEFGDWYSFLGDYSNATMMRNNSANSLPITYYMYQNIIIWVLFSTFPFALSQQVYLCAILLAMLLGKAITRLIFEINEEREYYEKRIGDCVVVKEKEIQLTDQKIRNWEKCHMQTLLFCGSLGRFFNMILFTTYSIDFMTFLGFMSGLIGRGKSDASTFLYFLPHLVFLAYGTVFLLPLVVVHEKVSIK